jgi:hypothetical protein
MWRLVQRYTDRAGYKRRVKSEGLAADPPVIDCSGWVGLLLKEAMEAENEAAGRAVFANDDVAAMRAWSDRIIAEIETRTGFIINGPEVPAGNLPRCATIGLKLGEPTGMADHPRPRGITHIAQVVRRPEDDAPFVSEAIASAVPPGIRLMPLMDWLALMRSRIRADEFWAVDPFRLGANGERPPNG